MKYNSEVKNTTAIDTMAKPPTINVPEDLEQCQEMIVQMHEQMQGMQEKLDLLLRAKYGKKSESIPVGQLRLFADESDSEEQAPEQDIPQDSGTAGRGHGRRKPAKELPRIRQFYFAIINRKGQHIICNVER